MIGARELECLPAGAVLINTARGDVLDEKALLAALASGSLAAAAVDVIHDEQKHQRGDCSSPLVEWSRSHPERLLITPHIGGATFESMENTEIFMANKLERLLQASAELRTRVPEKQGQR
jgi:D-3-phosphoglycerate dehydrogenase / 2-oxoglutarate reductase